MKRSPFTQAELTRFLAHARRVGHSYPTWLLREQVVLLMAVLNLSVEEILALRVSDVHVVRRGWSWLEVDGRKVRIWDRYTVSRMMVWHRRCVTYGYERWLTGPVGCGELDSRKLSQTMRRGVKPLFGAERWQCFSLRWMRLYCSRPNVRRTVENSLAEMLSWLDFGEANVFEDEIEVALRDSEVMRRALELGSMPFVRMQIRRIRSELRKLGLLAMMDVKRDVFEEYLRAARPGESDEWYMHKFYEWIGEELLGDGYEVQVDGVDAECGSGSGADGVCPGEGA